MLLVQARTTVFQEAYAKSAQPMQLQFMWGLESEHFKSHAEFPQWAWWTEQCHQSYTLENIIHNKFSSLGF